MKIEPARISTSSIAPGSKMVPANKICVCFYILLCLAWTRPNRLYLVLLHESVQDHKSLRQNELKLEARDSLQTS